MDIYSQIVESIVRHQEAIIGPVAIEQAQQIHGLHLNWETHQVAIDDDPIHTIDELVDSYKSLFGQVSVEVSKEAAAPLIGRLKPNSLPQTLR